MIRRRVLLGPVTLLMAVHALDAKISLYEPAAVPETDVVTHLDCGAQKPSVEIQLPIDTCLWGDYFLVNNIKITQYPTCEYGRPAVALFYDTTSCTGQPTFRSETSRGKPKPNSPSEITDRCLFASSPRQWSVVFRCRNYDSQAITKRNFRQAIPPSYESSPHNPPAASDGVITPYYSWDCTIYRPNIYQPTFLPPDVCLTLETSHSIYVSQPVVCNDGKAAVGTLYTDEECTAWNGVLGSDMWSDGYYASLDKTCHTVNARSIAFSCAGGDKTKFEKLPPHEHKNSTRLVLLPRPIDPELGPEPEPEPTKAHISGYSEQRCQRFPRRPVNSTMEHVDTCVQTSAYQSVSVNLRAVCGNGTEALIATYSRPGCDPENMVSLGPIDQRCVPTNNINSLVFWCKGFQPKSGTDDGGATDNGNDRIGGFIMVWFVLSLVLRLFMIVAAIGCIFRRAALMEQVGKFTQKVEEALFRRNEGAIRLE